LFEADLEILYSFFGAFSSENRNVGVSIQDALSMMMPAYQVAAKEKENGEKIIQLLNENIHKQDSSARYVGMF
jgi:hypothetical protein